MRFHIHTYGCQMNVRDSEAVGAMLTAAGHVRAAGEEDADLVIVNSCTVRQKAEEKALGKCGNLCAAKGRPQIVGLMGCAVKRLGADVFKKLPKLDFAVGPRRFGLIPKIVADLQAQGYPASRTGANRLELPDEDEVPDGLSAHADAPADGGADAFKSYVTILLGCDNRCSYCIVPDVRGHEYSRPAREVIAEVAALAARGVKEVCLLGQSVLRYGVRNKVWFDDNPIPQSPNPPIPQFDRVLVDAPCSNTGVLRRRPDARWRWNADHLKQLVALQAQILDAAAPFVAPGGRLVYSTCSNEPEENGEQVAAFLVRHPDFTEVTRRESVPFETDHDGAFACALERRGT